MIVAYKVVARYRAYLSLLRDGFTADGHVALLRSIAMPSQTYQWLKGTTYGFRSEA